MAGTVFLLVVTASLIINVAARIQVDGGEFDHLPRPNQIGS